MSTLDTLDDAVNYLQWIIDLAEPHLAARILEVGAGHGTYTEKLAARGTVTALEPSSSACEVLTSRFANHDRVTVIRGVLADLPADESFGAAVMINVLEHIDDDAGALEEILVPLVRAAEHRVRPPFGQSIFLVARKPAG